MFSKINENYHKNNISKSIILSKKENIALKDLIKIKIENNLPVPYREIYNELVSKKNFNELYSLKLKHKGLNESNTKLYIREYIKLKDKGYIFPKDEFNIFKDIDLGFIISDGTKFKLDDLYNLNYISKLRYKLRLFNLTDDDIYNIIKDEFLNE